MTAVVLFLLAAALLFSGGLALVLLRHAAKADDVYPPEAAEAPDPVDAQHDGYQRAAWFTGSEGHICPVIPGPEPRDAAVDNPEVAQLIWECRHALERLQRGDDIYAGARLEPSPEVQR